MGRRILMVAGDPSGDAHAALLAAELLRRDPALVLYGDGGPQMVAAGVDIGFDLPAISAIGVGDVLPNLLLGRRKLTERIAQVRAEPPDAAVLVDCGAFNLPLARELKALGVPVLGYFPPGSWSGSRKRAEDVAAAYTAVATPFPTPLKVYEELGLEHELVGHPLVDELAPLREQRPPAPFEPPVLALLPGSRRQEIRHILPPMLAAARLLRDDLPDLRVIVSRAPSAPAAEFDRVLARAGIEVEVVGGAREALLPATAAIIKSGTVTLEATLLGVPMTVVYRASHLAYAIAWLYYWPRPKYWAMPNILADAPIVPQLFQYHVTMRNVLAATRPLLAATAARREMVEALDGLRVQLSGGATARTAELLFELLRRAGG